MNTMHRRFRREGILSSGDTIMTGFTQGEIAIIEGITTI